MAGSTPLPPDAPAPGGTPATPAAPPPRHETLTTLAAQVAAADHDFAPEATVTPVGIFLPTLAELFVYGVTSNVTSDDTG